MKAMLLSMALWMNIPKQCRIYEIIVNKKKKKNLVTSGWMDNITLTSHCVYVFEQFEHYYKSHVNLHRI